MAVISVSPGSFNIDFDGLDFAAFTGVSAASAGSFRFNFSDGSYWSFTGTSLVFGGPNGLPTAGTLTSFLAFEPGDIQSASVGSLSLPAADFSNFVQTSDEVGAVNALLAGADTITGGGVADNIRGFNGDDLIFGGSGNDTIDGQDGNDAIAGGNDNDRIYGSTGDDFLFGDPGNDTVFGGVGNDTETGSTGDDTVYGDAGFDTLDGSDGDDRVYGGTEGDLLNGWIGNDTLYGGDGDDVMVGVAGDDRFYGGPGSDLVDYRGANGIVLDVTQGTVLDGQGGLDRFESVEIFIGSEFADTVVTGGVTNVFLIGVGGNDTLNGGNGNDTLAGGTGNDSLFGSQGDDLATGEDSNDIVYGSDGNDFAIGAAGNDLLYGDFGNDTVAGDAGIDTVYGGANNDIVHGGEDNDIVYGDDGNDLAIGWLGDDRLYGGAGNDIVAGDAGNDSIYGGDGNDLLVGHAGNDRIEGEIGDDTVFGDLDNDTVFGGSGNDSLDGFDGNDTTYGGVGNDNQFGGGGDDVVQGDDGNDVLNGGAGNDLVNGNSGDDTLAGNEGADTLYGGDDGDLLLGFDGDDIAVGDAGADVVSGGIGNDQLFGAAGIDIVFGEDGNDTVHGGTEIDALFGGAGNDTMYGDDGDDVHYGGTGNDLMYGGAGIDTAFYANVVATLGSSGDTTTIDAGADGIDVLIGFESIISSPAAPTTDVASLGVSRGFVIQGDAAGDVAGASVSSAGDVNGDGFDDLIIGAYGGDDDGASAGEAYVVFGTAAGFGTIDGSGRSVIDLTSLGSTQGFIIQGDHYGDYLGSGVAAAGDVNGDGFADLIVGAKYGDDAGGNGGEAYVVFGHAGVFGTAVTTAGVVRQVVDLTSLGSTQGFIIQSDSYGEHAGGSVSSAGDINGDGFDDLIVGAVGAFRGVEVAVRSNGGAFVVFGAAGDFGTAVTIAGVVRQVIDITSLDASQGFLIRGDAVYDSAGRSVSSAGDINGDGFDDVIIGADGADEDNGSGSAYVVFGTAGGFGAVDGSNRVVIDLSSLGTAQGFVIQGDGQFVSTGWSVSSAGDINGDGFDDLIVGAYRGGSGGYQSGDAYVLFGAAGGFGTVDGTGRSVIDFTSISTAQGFVIRGDAANNQAGFSVSDAGDVNGDGFDDLIVGAKGKNGGGSDDGAAYLIFGREDGFGVDVTGVAGVRRILDLSLLGTEDGFVITGDATLDHAGWSVSSAGDLNGDGFDDLIVGAPFNNDGGVDAGVAYVLFGAPFGSGAAVTATGSAGADILIGDRAADTLIGGGGEDVFRGGAGNDLIQVPDLDFADIDGGTGIDTLALIGSGLILALGGVAPAELTSIEHIDLTGSGNNTLTGDPQAFFDITEERGVGVPALAVDGNAGDAVQMAIAGGAWSQIGSTVVGSTTYDRWVWDPDGGGPRPATLNAELWLDTDLAASFI